MVGRRRTRLGRGGGMGPGLKRITAVATLVALSVPAPAWAAYPRGATMTINGKGRAHGVGLCMGGAKGRVLAGQAYTTVLRHYYRGTGVGTSSKTPSMIKVTMGYRPTFAVRGDGGSESFSVRDDSGSVVAQGGAGEKAVFWISSGTYRLSIVNGSGDVTDRESSSGPFRVTPGSGAVLKVPEVSSTYNRFRGHIIAAKDSRGRLNVINWLGLEDYVKGIAEEPDTWPMQGLYLTAVAARTYAAYRILHPKYAGEPYDLNATGESQYYLGYDYERIAPRLRQAVDRTKGKVVLYRGDIILAAYFANCGGHTEDAKNQWGGDYPYLTGVYCNAKGKTPYCATYHGYRWSTRTSFGRFTDKMGVKGVVTYFNRWVRGYHRSSTGSPRLYNVRINAHPTYRSKNVTGYQIQDAYDLQSNWIWFDLPPRIDRLFAPSFSPNGDGKVDKTRISFKLSERAYVRIYVKNRYGKVVYRRYARWQPAGWRSFFWDGTVSGGRKASAGRYRIQVVATDTKGNLNYAYRLLTVTSR